MLGHPDGDEVLHEGERGIRLEKETFEPATTRREFFTTMAAVAATAAVAGWDLFGSAAPVNAQAPVAGAGAASTAAQSRVAVLRHSGAMKPDLSVDAQVVQTLVDKAVCYATAEKKRAMAWKSLVTPKDIVGLKINCMGGPDCCTRPEVVNAIITGLLEAGVAAENIIVYESTNSALIKCGYTINANRGAVRCYATEEVGYDEQIVRVGPQPIRVSKIVSRQITALINVPIMKTVAGTAVTLALKNHFGSIMNPSVFHVENLRYAGYVSTADAIRTKTKICICDALRPLYNAGPGDDQRYRWNYGGIIASTDPVAHDAVGTDILLAKRKEVDPSAYSLPDAVRKIEFAAKLGLGVADLSKIDRTEIDLA